MKYLCLLSMLCICSFCNGQKECDSGYRFMPTLETSGLMIVADTCLPDSVCRRLWNEYNKSVCEETSMGWMAMGGEGSLSYWEQHTWTDSLGCKVTHEYRIMRKNKWVKITKKEYEILYKKQQ